MLCCVCYRIPALIFRGKAGFCSGCDNPAPFVAKAAEEDTKDQEEQAKLAAFREKQARKKQRRNNRGT